MTEIKYRVLPDNDLMQVYEGEDVAPMGLRLSPDTASLFASAPEMKERIDELKAEAAQLRETVERVRKLEGAVKAALPKVCCILLAEPESTSSLADKYKEAVRYAREIRDILTRNEASDDGTEGGG